MVRQYECLVGKVVNNLMCIKEIGHCSDKVVCRCIVCKKESIYAKPMFKAGKTSCRNQKCKLFGKNKHIDVEGMTINGFTCIEEVGYDAVLCRCNKCNNIEEYRKYNFRHAKIKCENENCHIERKSAVYA